jgi:hypothetical protein
MQRSEGRETAGDAEVRREQSASRRLSSGPFVFLRVSVSPRFVFFMIADIARAEMRSSKGARAA